MKVFLYKMGTKILELHPHKWTVPVGASKDKTKSMDWFTHKK